MEAQTPQIPDVNGNLTVDASRPFSSVKEAVAIFGERLFFGEFQSPKSPGFAFGKEKSYQPELELNANKLPDIDAAQVVESALIQSPSKPPNILANQVEGSLNESSQTSEISLTLDELPEIAKRKGIELALDKSSHSSELTPSPRVSSNTNSKEDMNSPMYELTPSPRNFKNDNHGNIVHGNDLVMMLMILKKLEAELQETKMELKLLKERESETEVALASLNAELHKNMSKIAKAEAAEAAKATGSSVPSLEGVHREIGRREEGTTRSNVILKHLDSPTLAQILSISDYESYFGDSKVRKLMKKKPIIPLVTDMFPRRKKSLPTHNVSGPLCSYHMSFA